MRLNLGSACGFVAIAQLLLSSLTVQAQLSSSAKVSLVTLYPGDAVYSLWGHSALHIEDPVLGLDIAYNYGTFEFGHPIGFLAKFAYGRLDYMLSLQQYSQWVNYSWFNQNRAVVEQPLNLTPAEKDSLYRFLTWNALPENRFYRYDFLYDNCATRIRDALEHVLGIPLADEHPTDATFRTAVKPYASQRPLLDLAMNLGMGLPADSIPTRRDQTFLPLDLAAVAADAHKSDGTALVQSTDTLFGLPNPPSERTSMPWTAVLLWLVLGWGIVQTVLNRKAPKRHMTDWVFFSVVGAAGLLLAFLSFISLHTVTWPNVHLLWAWPAHSVLIWLKHAWTRYYWMVSGVSAAIWLAGMPFWAQGVPADVIPIAMMCVLRSTALAFVPRTGFEPVLPA